MKILMMTNTFTPHVGGVARSVTFFTEEYRRLGHEVKIIAPEFDDEPEDESDVIRVPAIQNFNGSDFSVALPVPFGVMSTLSDWEPDIVHSHHPFLLGDMALRITAHFNVPLVFTHHTMYERYTHYVPGDSRHMQRFVIELATGYANQCDAVFAPSESVAEVLRERGVQTPIDPVPTGVHIKEFESGDGSRIRKELGIPADATVLGHLGRLAPEKNLELLSEAVLDAMTDTPGTHFLVVGSGPSEKHIREIFAEKGLSERLHLAGRRSGQDLVDAYHAMDLFAFASTSETQGMVLTEAMAAGVPVVALDAPGAREVVHSGKNGYLVQEESAEDLCAAICKWLELGQADRERFIEGAKRTAEEFSMVRCAEKALGVYVRLLNQEIQHASPEEVAWNRLLDQVRTEWEMFSNFATAVASAVTETDPMKKLKSKESREKKRLG